jgi:hypothetical protein
MSLWWVEPKQLVRLTKMLGLQGRRTPRTWLRCAGTFTPDAGECVCRTDAISRRGCPVKRSARLAL